MGFAKPIEQIFIKLSRYIYVSKRYYTRRDVMKHGKWLIPAAVFFVLAGFVFKFAVTGYVITAALCWVTAAVLFFYMIFLKYRLKKTMRAFSGLLLAGFLLFCVIQGFILKESGGSLNGAPDYLIILGAGLYGETPSPAPRRRPGSAFSYLSRCCSGPGDARPW